MSKVAVVILAAGKGTRMKSKLPKVMHPLAGKPLIDHVLDLAEVAGSNRPLVILGHGRELIEEHIQTRAEIVLQLEQLGTGHALMQALPYLKDEEDILVLSGDQPLLCADTVQTMLEQHQKHEAAATVLTAVLPEPFGYGRVIRNGQNLHKIVEEKDATDSERQVKEINTGTYCFKASYLKEALADLRPKNAQKEYYLTGVFDFLLAQEHSVMTFAATDSNEALGINSRSQLAEAEQIYRQRLIRYWLDEGVTMIDPATVYIDAEVSLSADVTLLPFVHLQGKTVICEGAVIGPQVELKSSYCGQGSHISHSIVLDARIGDDCTVGPFAYLRPGTILEDHVKIGDFVEVKKSKIGEGSKIPHLSYIGDAEIGQKVNIGAGTITCNYDGVRKHPTKIGDQAFVGSNTNLVAPVVVGENSLIGAGSTITKDVPAQALAVERGELRIKNNWRRRVIE